MAQTDTQTDGHGDSMTNSAQWGRVGEKHSQSMALKADLIESAPRAQGKVMNQMSGSSGSGASNPRPSSRSPGGPRDRGASMGRDKTKNHSNSKGTPSPGRSKSVARECWECHKVVSGDHCGHNCPKTKKKGEES